ncbi:MAG: ribbon-helix-helix protein, CopG family [Thermoproteota archaeon]|nr:ribbon-helix-helix protein, CopG family [Thermoproteota archaeon]
MPEIRVTIDEKLNALLDELVASGLYPSKAELVRCGIIQLLKEFGFLPHFVNLKKKNR